MSRIDAWLARSKLPGSPAAKAAVTAVAITALLAYPVFRSREGRQGHDYLSSERPEAVSAGQDRARRENRRKLGLALETKEDTTSSSSEGKQE